MSPSLRRYIPPLVAGVLGAAMLSALYLGIVSLAGSPEHAIELFWQDKAFVVPIILGFGTQVGLYTFLKKGMYAPKHASVAGATTAASGGMSTAAMVACCAHHAAEVLPLIGLTAAATFLANWKGPFVVVGLTMNLAGIMFMLREIRKARGHAVHQALSSEVAA